MASELRKCLTGRKCCRTHDAIVKSRIKELVFIRTLRLKFQCLNPLKKNSKEAEMGMVLI